MKNIELSKPHPAASIPAFLNFTCVGVLAGIAFCVQLGLVPAMNQMDNTTYLNVMQKIIPTFTRAVIPLMALGLAAFLTRLFIYKPDCLGARRWIAASFLFFIAGAAITIAGHFPINHQLMNSTPQNSPATLETLRLKWNVLNLWRFAVAQLAFLCVLVPAAFGRRASTVASNSKSENIASLEKSIAAS